MSPLRRKTFYKLSSKDALFALRIEISEGKRLVVQLACPSAKSKVVQSQRSGLLENRDTTPLLEV